jgi:hypothetical protein
MYIKPNPFESEIFEYHRIQEKTKAIKNSIEVLTFHGYTILDLEGKIIRKEIKE